MIGILEIVLTIYAWRNGWRWRALLPVGGALVVAFMIGVLAGVAGITEAQNPQLQIALIPLDLAAVGILIGMCAKVKKQAAEAETIAVTEAPEAVKQAA
jgi:hypothetical protein